MPSLKAYQIIVICWDCFKIQSSDVIFILPQIIFMAASKWALNLLLVYCCAYSLVYLSAQPHLTRKMSNMIGSDLHSSSLPCWTKVQNKLPGPEWRSQHCVFQGSFCCMFNKHTDVRSGNKKKKRKIDDENIICITIPKEIKQMKC